MITDYIKKKEDQIEEIKAELEYASTLAECGIIISGVRLKRGDNAEFHISREDSTVSTLQTVLDKFILVPEYKINCKQGKFNISFTVHTSDVIGNYLLIRTNFGEFRFLLNSSYTLLYEALDVTFGDWEKSINGKPFTGSWGRENYAGGSCSFWPLKDYSKEEYVKFLTPLLWVQI